MENLKIFNWYYIALTLVNDDITKIEEVMNMKFKFIVDYLNICFNRNLINKLKPKK
jgi:hypothetical protein